MPTSFDKSTSFDMSTSFDLSRVCTTIITTSPAPSHPSIDLIEQVLRSIAFHAPGLAACRTIIVCDGFKLVEGKCNFRGARVDDAAAQKYAAYKIALRALLESPPLKHCEVIELSRQHGFGFAVRAALTSVDTPLVCVIQHDRVLLRACDDSIQEVAARMLQQPASGEASVGDPPHEVGYALLPTRTALPKEYAHKCRIRLGERGIRPPASDIEPHAIALPSGKRSLLPLLAFFDSTHLCLTRHYLEVILPSCTKGAFIESEVGPLQLAEVESGGIAHMLSRWKCYLLDDGESGVPLVGHLNGAVNRLAKGEMPCACRNGEKWACSACARVHAVKS